MARTPHDLAATLERYQVATLGRVQSQGRWLAGLQAIQIVMGLAGQLLLLVRWSPHIQTDFFLLVSGVPWIFSAIMLVSSIEMALPAVYHKVENHELLIRQITSLTLLAGLIGAATSSAVIIVWAHQASLGTELSLWLGAGVGLQVLPAALASLWRGILIVHDKLVSMRLTLLGGSLVTASGYAILAPPPARSLPILALLTTTITALLAWHFCDNSANIRLASLRPLHPGIARLLRALGTLSIAVIILHVQTLIERTAVIDLGTGYVTALSIVMRGWEAVTAIAVAAFVMPVFPRWAAGQRGLLRWSLCRTTSLSLITAICGGCIALVLLSLMTWEMGRKTAELVLALLPRFVLLCSLQPLVLKHYAQGTPWYPVLGSIIGLAIVGLGAVLLVPRFKMLGLAVTTGTGVLPGWVLLGWMEWRTRST